jgi:MEMO1 family protein
MTPTIGIRPPAVAGQFYAGDPVTLQRDLARLLANSQSTTTPPKALIVPHAGYIYSGESAASAYQTLRSVRGRIKRVVILGPAHRVYVRGCALSSATAFQTPLGDVPLIAPPAELRALPFVGINDRAHAPEHSLEVQLPFLQTVLDEFSLLPIVVGEASPDEVAGVLKVVWGGDETLIVISTDLSHFLTYTDATQRDHATIARVLAGATDLRHDEACGATPLNGFLLEAQRRGLKGRLLNLCNSGDTAGPRERVVGYGALAFADQLSPGSTLLAIARGRIASCLHLGNEPAFTHPWLVELAATFVTITREGQLRGCIGSLDVRRAIGIDVAENAAAAAFRDPRFAPLSVTEYPQVKIEVSRLSGADPLTFTDEADALSQLRPLVDGVVFECDGRRATFLPQVWTQLRSPAQFLQHLKQKAGFVTDFWSPEVKLARYTVDKWCEL